MTQLITAPNRISADLLERLGNIPLDRVRFDPPPGTATIEDLDHPKNQRCELVDGTLVEKPVGWKESSLGLWIGTLLNIYIVPQDLGKTSGETGFMELEEGLVRGPSFAFISWERLPVDLPDYPAMVPDFVFEVLYPSNTKAEMLRKRDDYFRTGVRLVWEVDPRTRTVDVFTSATEFTSKAEGDSLSGEDVIPGLVLAVAQIFKEMDRGRIA